MKRIGLAFLPLLVLLHAACLFDSSDNCAAAKLCIDGGGAPTATTTGGNGGAGANGGSAAGGNTGGGAQGGGGQNPTCTEQPELCNGATPVCDNGSCVQCNDANTTACTADTPTCNTTTHLCEPCSFHTDCPASACNPFTGACLNATPKTVGPSGEFANLAAALAPLSAGEEAVFLLSPDTGNANYQQALDVDNSRTVAILGQNGRPTLQGTGGNPTIDVANGATLLLHNVDLKSNSSLALQVAGLVALDNVEISANLGGGINATSTANLLLRNTIVAANGATTEDAIVLNDADATILYSSIAGFQDPLSDAIACAGGYSLTVRNSILLKRNPTGDPLSGCTTATVTTTHSGNIDNTTGLSWFANWPTNLRLKAAGASQFADIARWRTHDPPTDIDATPRPTTDDSPDTAGADIGP